MSFSEQLKKAMLERNMTQAELSALTGIGKSSISQYISGKNEPKELALNKIAEALDCSVAFLKGETECSDMENVKGFKVFNPDWTCRGFQYEVGKVYEENVTPSVCDRGFHFCKQAKDCFNYYQFDPNNKVAEVIALGDIAEEGDKCCTNIIKIEREITWEEVLTIVNTGKACTGLCNSGDW